MAELNLIPSSMKKKNNQKYKTLNIVFGIIIAVAALFFALYIPFISLIQLRVKEFALKAKVEAQNNVVEERNRMMEQMNQTNELINLVDSLDIDRRLVYQYFVDLQAYFPADVNCTSFNYTDTMISISGVAENYKSPEILVANLQESENYKYANLLNISNSDLGYTFSINITLMK